MIESGYPEGGVLADSFRTLNKLTDTRWIRNERTRQIQRHFRVFLGDRKSLRWNTESDLPAAVEDMYGLRKNGASQETTLGTIDIMSAGLDLTMEDNPIIL